ncbi:Chloride conductance regulatory protein ICln [Hibiscus syriacus]|uniref:Chloride conductance regulatory protein ICln n=1 Tax=Hibiscus syriacus TaxID=106335 RepID=A0A6A3D719_HIBSY|nr:Chloride conductance regulatory protein ICln [Hibiscus syriacus]
MLYLEGEEGHNWIFNADQFQDEAGEGDDSGWHFSVNLTNIIGHSDGDHDLSRNVLELQINDQRFEDAEEMEEVAHSGRHHQPQKGSMVVASEMVQRGDYPIMSTFYDKVAVFVGDVWLRRYDGLTVSTITEVTATLMVATPSSKSNCHYHQLRMGSKMYIVISSPSIAKEILKVQDATFANRDTPVAAINGTYGGLDIVWRSNGPELHKLRKLVVREIMCNKGLDACYELRRREIRQMVKYIHGKTGSSINCCGRWLSDRVKLQLII